MNEKRTAKAKEIAISALQLFVAKGYASTSVEEIAAAASIGKSTVYEYYATKEKLFVEAIMTGADLWLEELQAIGRDSQNPIECLQNVGYLYFKSNRQEFAMESKLFIEVISQTVLNGGALFNLGHEIQNIYRQVVRIVTDFLLAGVSRGQLRPDIARDAEKIAINYLAFLDGIKMHSMIADDYVRARNQIDFYLKHLACLIQPPPANPERKQ